MVFNPFRRDGDHLSRPKARGGARDTARATRGLHRPSSRASLKTLVEHLERRVVLSADPIVGCLCESNIATLMWQGREVEVVRDSWVMRMPQTNAATARTAADYRSDRPTVPDGWTVRDIGLGFYGITAPGAAMTTVTGWASLTGVSLVQPNLVHRKQATIPNEGPTNPPTNPGFDSLWGLRNTGQVGAVDYAPAGDLPAAGTPGSDIDVPNAWSRFTTGSRNVIIAVMDDGIDYTHADLQANMWTRPADVPASRYGLHGWDSADDDGDIRSANLDDSHGTHVAGTIGATGNNGLGVTGVMQSVQLYGAKVFGDGGGGTTADLIDAIGRVVDLRVTYGQNIVAINASLGFVGPEIPALTSAIAAADGAGILFVAAAGNGEDRPNDQIGDDNDSVPSYPANTRLPNVISVAASNRRDELTSFSNWGQSVHIAAPGSGIWSTIPGNAYAEYPGTSMAAPHVAGVAGLIASAFLAETGELPSPEIMKSAILNGADVIATVPGVSGLTNATTQGFVAGNRRLNAFGALQQLPVVVSMSDAEILEGDAGETTVQLTVTLSRAITQPVTVSYATRDGTALASDDDYAPTSGQITFGPGQTTRTISVTVNGDEWFERDEYFDVVITGVSGATAETRPGTVTILNDDPEIMRIDVLPAVAMKRTGPTVAEFVLRPYMPVREVLRIAYTTIDGTARARRDYRPNSGIIELRPGQSEKRVQVSVLGNRRQDRDKTFSLGFEVLAGPDALLYNPTDGSRDPGRLAVPGLILDTNSRHFSIVPDTAITDGTFGFTIQLDRPRQFGDVLPTFEGLETLSPEILGELGRNLRFTTHYMIGHQSVGRILRRPPAPAAGEVIAGVVELGYLVDPESGELVTRTSERIEVPVDEQTPVRSVVAEVFSPTNAQIKPGGGKVTLRSLLTAVEVERATPARRLLPIFARRLR